MIPAIDPEFKSVLAFPGSFKNPPPPDRGGLQPPGGGGTYDGMLEVRVASLEVDVKNIRENVGEMKLDLKSAGKDLTEIKVGFAGLDVRVQHLPTFKQNFALLSGMLGLVALLIVFQGHIQKYLGPSSSVPVTVVSPPKKP